MCVIPLTVGDDVVFPVAERLAQSLRGRLVVDALILVVDHRDFGHALFARERSCRAAGDGHIPLPLPGGVVLAAAPGDAHLLRTFTDGGIGQQIFCAAFQRHPCFADAAPRAALSRSIILDGHIIHGQSRVRAHNDRIPDLLPDVVIDRRAVGSEGELERRVFLRHRFDAWALGEGHRRRFRGRLVSIVALEADLDLLLTRRNGGVSCKIDLIAIQFHPFMSPSR